ncbi:MAG: hypothetical protein AB8B92_11210 [Gammaproteobacteria bacterium]
MYKIKFLIVTIVMPMSLVACGALSWYSIEQTPADSVAYLRDGVFLSGDYVRSASISEINGNSNIARENALIKISTGKHQVKIYCEEAVGEFNSLEFIGKAKVLELHAKIQRTYHVRCKPYTHWWIEDVENGEIVAGEKYI